MTRSLQSSIMIFTTICAFVLLAACSPSATPTTAPTTEPESVAATPTAESAAADVTAVVEVEATAAATCTRLNLNTVTEDQLLSTMPDFSNRMVREFFEYRPYVSIQQFRREIGKYVDQAQVTAWEAYVYVPVDFNNSDADTLQQIPGIDSTAAAALMAGRPYADQQAFLDALAESLSTEQVNQATCYLAEA